MTVKWFKDCTYSAFISYAHADDRGWNDWVTCFSKELDMTLPTRLRGIPVPKVHLSGKNGPVMGDLGDELRARIDASFAMILVVHDNYAESGWCQQELAYFKSLFGDEGFRQRLYIVALSQTAMEQVMATDEWKQLSGGANLVYMHFFQEEDPDMPIGIYSDKGIVANAFWTPFVRLREDFAKKIKGNVELQGSARTPAVALGAAAPAAAVAGVPAAIDDSVRIYIESNQNEVDHWESVGAQVVKRWDAVVAGMALAPPLYVRPSGLPMDRIDQYPRLDDADGVILLWGQKTCDSLVAQIRKVEQKLSGRDLAPGVVAYLMPPQGATEQAVSAFGWPVVRFNAPAAQGIEVVPHDEAKLDAFLRKVLERRKLRMSQASEAVLVSQP
jgi:hypothetical protein